MADRHYFLRLEQTLESDNFILFCNGRVITRGTDYLWKKADIARHFSGESCFHLIQDGEKALLAAHVNADIIAGLQAQDCSLRSLLLEGGKRILPQAGKANQILDWYLAHRYCGSCGSPTLHHESQRAVHCPRCQRFFFPRINPCVIVLVVDGRNMLLARNARYQGSFYSCLAGFIEVGESAEDTIHREIMEEVGIKVKNIRYIKSQCWPFPSQLMLGFWADYAGGEITPDGEEIEEARWFDVDALPSFPGAGISVAGELISRYIAYVDDSGL